MKTQFIIVLASKKLMSYSFFQIIFLKTLWFAQIFMHMAFRAYGQPRLGIKTKEIFGSHGVQIIYAEGGGINVDRVNQNSIRVRVWFLMVSRLPFGEGTVYMSH